MRTLIKERKSGAVIYPSQKDIFNAFRFTKFSKIKVVILGQDPYFREGQAHGLAFSVRYGVPIPASLLNIYKELENSVDNFIRPTHGCLENWAYQGVFLLNTVLTVQAGLPRSHFNYGWQIFTNKVINLISKYRKGVVFLLWGSYAQKKEKIIDKKHHLILKTSHPSPFSAHLGFLGCKHFKIVNQWLENRGEKSIDWNPILKNNKSLCECNS